MPMIILLNAQGILFSVGNFGEDPIQFWVHHGTVVPVTFNLTLI